MAFRIEIGEIIFQTLNYCCLKQGIKGDRLRLAEKRQKNLKLQLSKKHFLAKGQQWFPQKKSFFSGKALFFFLSYPLLMATVSPFLVTPAITRLNTG